MGWLTRIFGPSRVQREAVLQALGEKFNVFRSLLDQHNHVLKLISRLEERHKNQEVQSLPSLWQDFVEIREGTQELIDRMIALGGESYLPLKDRLAALSKEVETNLPPLQPTPRDDFIIPFSRLGKERARSVGAKNANLGEMKSRLGLPVPDGFAISAWAYQHFLTQNQLKEKIQKSLSTMWVRRYEHLEVASEEIRELVTMKPVPEDLAQAILSAFDELASRSGERGFALRSSGVGEDETFSFAGQYQSKLNVRREDLLEAYKSILASKFTPAVIYYLLSHSLSELDVGMGVACMEMVEAVASGVMYTRDPLNPTADYVLVNAIFGLGSYLVEGKLTPDVYRVSRRGEGVIFSSVARKPKRLALCPDGGVVEEEVPAAEQELPALSEPHLLQLAEWAELLERHYGGPQDVEWALDRSGKLFALQTRPLKIPEPTAVVQPPEGVPVRELIRGGIPICAGVGIGKVFHLGAVPDLPSVPEDVILITPNPSPYLAPVLPKLRGLITMVGGNTSHLATIARELSVPTIAGMKEASKLPAGQEVTMDAGQAVIYEGAHPEWIVAPAKTPSSVLDPQTEATISRMLAPITHLTVIPPHDPRFTPENCFSLHDIVRFIHQKAMEEIFSSLTKTSGKEKLGLRLKTRIPLLINIIYLDQDPQTLAGKRWVLESEIASRPMKALWEGVLKEGWPETQVPADLKGFLAVVGTNLQEGHQPEFSENSYAFLSQDYMLLNLRMGYHFSTIEALVTPQVEKNYVRMQFKLGGAPLERRIRRVWLICELLSCLGFENKSQGDYLDSVVAYRGEEEMLERLHLLGRITILTKQLDMTLSSDARARWYLNEFKKKLGLNSKGDKENGNEARG